MSVSENYIATWIYLNRGKEKNFYPNLGRIRNLMGYSVIYWKCVVVFFTSSLKFNTSVKHILFSNIGPDELPVIMGFSLRKFLSDMNIGFHQVERRYHLPSGYYHAFQSQFFIFDIFEYIRRNREKFQGGNFLILDADCLIIKNLSSIFDRIKSRKLLVYPIEFKPDKKINGLSRMDLSVIYRRLGIIPVPEPADYFGGEFFAAGFETIDSIGDLFPDLLKRMLDDHEKGLIKFNEEAHVLSYLYVRLGYAFHVSDIVKRLWTTPMNKPISINDMDLYILHLPFEKNYGFPYLFRRIRKDSAAFMKLDNSQYLELIKDLMGVPVRKLYLNFSHWFLYTRIGKIYYQLKVASS